MAAPTNNAMVLTLAALCAAPATASPHDDKRWHREEIEFQVRGDAASLATPSLVRALRAAAATWNETGAGPRIDVSESEAEADGRGPIQKDGKNSVGVWPGEWAWTPEAGAVTIAWPSDDGAEIVEADLALNPAVPWTFDPENNSGAYDVQNVLTHELGHAIGLPDFRDAPDATMFFVILPGETHKRRLAHEDENMLFQLYEGIDDPNPGCSAAGLDSTAEAALALVVLAAFRRKR